MFVVKRLTFSIYIHRDSLYIECLYMDVYVVAVAPSKNHGISLLLYLFFFKQ